MSKPNEVPTLVRLNSVGLKSDDGEAAVVRDGGKYNSGLIRGFSAIMSGEALGHYLWIDDVFLAQVATAGKKGVKSRFTHPGLSGDGLGKALGRAVAFRVEGDRVRADLHIHKSAHRTPEGNLAGYLMDRAEEAPDEFGASLVFDLDHGEMHRFRAQHEDEDGDFKSPDKANDNNHSHARLAGLSAVDMVGDPAANADGLFSRGSVLPAAADAALAYAFGLTESAPEVTVLGIHPDRIRIFLADFLERRSLEVIPKPPQDGAGKDSEMEWADVTADTLSEHCPVVAGALRSEGVEEAEKKFAADVKTAKDEAAAAATVETLKAERARTAVVFAKAHDLRLPMDDDVVRKAFAEGLEGDALTIAFQAKALANVASAAPEAPDPDAPPQPPERPSPKVAGLSAEDAWEKNARLPDGTLIQEEFAENGKEGFLNWAKVDAEGKKLFNS